MTYLKAGFKLCPYNFIMFVPIVTIHLFVAFWYWIGVLLYKISDNILDKLPKFKQDDEQMKLHLESLHQKDIDHYNR